MKVRGEWLWSDFLVVVLGWALCGSSLVSCGRAATPTESPPAAGIAPTEQRKSLPPPSVSEPAPRYELGSASVRMLASLQKPMRIDMYVARGLPELDVFVRDVKSMLDEYQRQSQGKLQIRIIEPNTPALREQAERDGVSAQRFDQDDQGSGPAVQGHLGLVFHYGSEKAAIPQLPHDYTSGLEFWITSKIRELRDQADGTKRRIGVVTGKGELMLTDPNLVPRLAPEGKQVPTLQGIMEQAFPYYRFEQVELKGGSLPIDPGLSGVIITQPKLDYSEPELRRLDEFLMRGDKTLLVYASAVNVAPQDPSLKATLSTRRLDQLLDGYGIHLNQDALFDYGSSFQVDVMTPENAGEIIRHPGLVKVVYEADKPQLEQRLATGFAVFFRMDEVMFPFPSSLELRRDRQPADVKLEVVARTTPEGSREQGKTVDLKPRAGWQPRPPLQSYALAAYAQGNLRSAFADRPLSSVPVPERAPRPSRLLVISSSLFLTNPFAYVANPPASSPRASDASLLVLAQPYTKNLTATIIAFKNALDWMTGDDDLVALSAKLIAPRRPPARPQNPRSVP